MTAWYFYSVTSGGRADSYSDIVLFVPIIRSHLLELTELCVFVRRRSDGWRVAVGGGGERGVLDTAGSQRYSRASQVDLTHPSGVGMAVPGACALATPALDIM